MSEKTLHHCPICKVQSLVMHCDGGRCGWYLCRNKACDAILDPTRRRGHKLNPDPKLPRIRVRLVGNEREVAA